MNDLELAKGLLESGGFTCVMCRGKKTLTSVSPGISPLLGWLGDGADMSGFSAADRIVGKAAALLFVLAGVRAVHGRVMSERALPVLLSHGVEATYDELVDVIINRQGTGPCPMERAVMDIDEPAAALPALKDALAALRSAAGSS